MRPGDRLRTVTPMTTDDAPVRASLPELAELLRNEAKLLNGWQRIAATPALPLDLSAEREQIADIVHLLHTMADALADAHHRMTCTGMRFDPVRPDGRRWGAGEDDPVPTTLDLLSAALAPVGRPGAGTYKELMAWPNPDLVDWRAPELQG